jgi:hypothetical protein
MIMKIVGTTIMSMAQTVITTMIISMGTSMLSLCNS